VCTVWRMLPDRVRQHSPHSYNSYNRTDNYRQWNAVGSPDDEHKDAQNMLRYS